MINKQYIINGRENMKTKTVCENGKVYQYIPQTTINPLRLYKNVDCLGSVWEYLNIEYVVNKVKQ